MICTDKTGTLTENRMQVRTLHLGGASLDATPSGLAGLGAAHTQFFQAAAICRDLRGDAGDGPPMGDPMDLASREFAVAAGGDGAAMARPPLAELPFDAERMRHSVRHATPEGPLHGCKGAPEQSCRSARR